jgi:hypothetical protein
MKKPLQTDNTNEPLLAARSSSPALYKKGLHTSGDADSKLPEKFRTVSLKSIAELLDTTRSSARRWLKEASIHPVALSRGAKGAIRYKWKDIEAWLNSLEYDE